MVIMLVVTRETTTTEKAQQRAKIRPKAGRLGVAATTALIALLSMAPALATDMYLPALPAMTSDLATTEGMATMTVTVFFVALAVGMLIVGTVSDARGRQPVIIVCSAVTGVLCVVAMFATDVGVLIFVRAIQGFAAGGMCALATSLVKDCFEGHQMDVVMSIVQIAGFLAPTLAPLIGAAILQFASWRGVFVVLAVLMLVSLLGTVALGETLPPEQRQAQDIKAAFGGLVEIARTRSLRTLTLGSGFALMSFMPYLGVASFVYQSYFGLNEAGFGVMFALASIIGAAGPMVYLKTINCSLDKMMLLAIAIETLGAILMLTVASSHFIVFFCCMMPCLFITGVMKPRVATTMLNRSTVDAGATSSALNFAHSVIGSAGMVAVSLIVWTDQIHALGFIILAFAVLAWLFWLPARKKILPELESPGLESHE